MTEKMGRGNQEQKSSNSLTYHPDGSLDAASGKKIADAISQKKQEERKKAITNAAREQKEWYESFLKEIIMPGSGATSEEGETAVAGLEAFYQQQLNEERQKGLRQFMEKPSLFRLGANRAEIRKRAEQLQRFGEAYLPEQYKDDASILEKIGNWTAVGLSNFNAALFKTLDLLPTELIFGEENDPLHNLNEYYSDQARQWNEIAEKNTKTKIGKGFGTLYSSVVSALPQAVLALMTAGQSTTVTIPANAGQAFNVVNALSASANQYAKSPSFWLSFAQNAGPSYERNLDKGANKIQATAAALISGLANATIEMGGGIEAIGSNTGLRGMARSAAEEAAEGSVQYTVENAVNKGTYQPGMPWYSTREDAVINPAAQAKIALEDAVAGGILNAGQQGIRKAKTIFDVLNEYCMGDIEGTILNAENAQVLTQRENIPILYDYMQNRYPGQGYQVSEAVIRSAKNFLNQAGKPAIVDTEQQKAYNGNSKSDFLDQAAGMEKPYTPKQIEEFAKANGVKTSSMPYENIFEFCDGRQDLAENLIKAIPESYGDESLSIAERVEKYQLPENPAEHSLSAYQTRIWYKWQESLIKSRLDYSKPLEEVAKQAFEMRNKIRTQARMSMSDTQWAQHLLENEKNKKFVKLVEKYQDVGYTGEDLWKEIIAASMRSRDSVDDLFGLNK